MGKITGQVQYPTTGSVVEFMLGNKPQPAYVLEEQKDNLRVLAITKREMRLPRNRLLPWSGPHHTSLSDRQAIQHCLQEHQTRREAAAENIDPMQLWEMAEGEVPRATAQWFAELLWAEPDIDQVAAVGRALLGCKVHFRFNPPDFEIFPEDEVERRRSAQEASRLKEQLINGGREFIQALWDMYSRRRKNNPAEPDPATAERLERLLLARVKDPEDSESSALWKEISKGLPELPHMPLFLLQAWGKLPEHYNYLLDRADYDPGTDWGAAYRGEVEQVAAGALVCETGDNSDPCVDWSDLSFFTMDAASTQDIDDACCLERLDDGGYLARLAFACPALAWPFGSELDKAVMRRASSIYLPEDTYHMLPPPLGTEVYSLKTGQNRPAMVLSLHIDADGKLRKADFSVACVKIAANLTYEGCEDALQGRDTPRAEAVRPWLPVVRLGDELAEKLKVQRLRSGAVIIERNDPEILLEERDGQTVVTVAAAEESSRSQNIIGEIMLLANTAAANWAVEREVPLVYRTQDVAVPPDYYGIWKEPHDIARVVKVLPQATLSVTPRRHVGVGSPAYATITSPLRRYCDLLNESQILSYLQTGTPRLAKEELGQAVSQLTARLDVVSQIQRFRPRYWKLLFLKQQGDKAWHEAVITEENDAAVFLSLPLTQIILRGKRGLFGDKVQAGQRCQVRVGKISPVNNDIQILEVREAE